MAVNESQTRQEHKWASWRASGAVGGMETAKARTPQEYIIYAREEVSGVEDLQAKRQESLDQAAELGLENRVTLIFPKAGAVIDVFIPVGSPKTTQHILELFRLREVPGPQAPASTTETTF